MGTGAFAELQTPLKGKESGESGTRVSQNQSCPLRCAEGLPKWRLWLAFKLPVHSPGRNHFKCLGF
jgi:hypothetical protein